MKEVKQVIEICLTFFDFYGIIVLYYFERIDLLMHGLKNFKSQLTVHKQSDITKALFDFHAWLFSCHGITDSMYLRMSSKEKAKYSNLYLKSFENN